GRLPLARLPVRALHPCGAALQTCPRAQRRGGDTLRQADGRVKLKLLSLSQRQSMNHEATRNDTKQGACRARVRFVWSRGVSVLLFVLVFQLVGPHTLAQKRKSPTPATSKEKKKDEKTTAAEALAASRDEFIRLTNEYKKS